MPFPRRWDGDHERVWREWPEGVKPDTIHDPAAVPEELFVKKSVVDTVLTGLIAAGNGVVSLVAGLLAGVLVLYSAFVIYDDFTTTNKAYSSWDLLQYKPEIISDGQVPLSGSLLEDVLDGYRAWLTVYDTNIDYPVMQGMDDLYYASHDIYGYGSLTGAIYLAASNSGDLSDTYNLIYGHHMDNGAMFGGLDAFLDGTYLREHNQGIIVGPKGAYDIVFFAAVETDAYHSVVYSPGNNMENVLKLLQGGGDEKTNVIVYDDIALYQGGAPQRIVALSTCADATTNGRLVVFGKMIQRDLLTITAEGYEGFYDGLSHGITVKVSREEDTTVTYSIDGGVTWTETPPVITDAGTIEVLIRAVNTTNGSASARVTMTVKPLDIDLKVYSYTGKKDGNPHTVTVDTAALPAGTVLEYSLDGASWSPTAPTLSKAGTMTVYVRAVNSPNYNTAEGVGTVELYSVTHALTVRYVTENEPDAVRTYYLDEGDEYTVVTPARLGYKPDQESVSGVLTEDTEIVVRYTRQRYQLTVRYVDLDGKEIADASVSMRYAGEQYSIAVPVIPGYMTARTSVTGEMSGRDEVITVIFVKDEEKIVHMISIDEYEAPLGLEDVNMQVGVCFE